MKKRKRKSKKKLEFVVIEWIDAEDQAGWIKHELPEPPRYYSAGWVLKSTKDSLYLAASIGKNIDENGTMMQIPHGMIKKITKWPKLTI